MSQDPFHRDSNVPPAAPASTSPPPPKKRRTWLWIIATLIAGGFLTLLICCGAGAYFVQNYGSFIFDPMRKELNQVAELREEVGEIESLNMNFFATAEEVKTNPEYVILDGKGEKGPFQLSVKMANSGDFEKVFLVLEDGTRRPIDTSKLLDPDPADSTDKDDKPSATTDGEQTREKDLKTDAEKPVEQQADEPAAS